MRDALLGRQREQVDRVVALQRCTGLQPAGQQHLLDQRIEFADVGVDLLPQAFALRARQTGRCVLQHRHRHLQPRQRRAQLVAGVGQQALLGTQQGLDARCGAVEAGAQRGHFVAPVFGHTMVQRAGTKGLDALLQRVEPARQAPHHRPGAGGNGRKQHQQQGRDAHAAGQPGPPGQRRRWRRPRPRRRHATAHAQAAVHAGSPGPAGTRRRPHHPQRAPVLQPHRLRTSPPRHVVRLALQVGVGRADALAVGIVQRQRQAQPHRPVAQCGGLLRRRRVGAGQRALQQITPRRGTLLRAGDEVLALLVEVALHQPAGDHGEQRQRDQHRQVDAQGQRAHSGPHCDLAKT